MINILVKHKVTDFKTWKTTFDSVSGIRKAGGEKSFKIMHPDGEPNSLVVMFEWDTIEHAHKYFTSEDLKKAMGKAGVIGAPEVSFLNVAAKGTL